MKNYLFDLKQLLDEKVDQYNKPGFIELDPISIPHRFTIQQDIEIAGLFAAVLAWGQRKTIIHNCNKLMELMSNSPFDFMINHKIADRRPFRNFKHRTFNGTDLLYFIEFLSGYYKSHWSLQEAFGNFPEAVNTERALSNFHNRFFEQKHPKRTLKHLSSPLKNSACKRLNMFLRWMVRNDHKGVDFGIWKSISPAQLVCPCDVHVERVARKLGLIHRKTVDWKTALELTESLKQFDQYDPVKYDFALFGLGLEGNFK